MMRSLLSFVHPTALAISATAVAVVGSAGAQPCLSFTNAVDYPAGNRPTSIAVGDFNGDGDLDLVMNTTPGFGTLVVLLGTGGGAFAAPVAYGAGNSPVFVAVDDLDGDGALDLVASNYNGSDVSVLLGIGDGTFATAVNYAANLSPTSVAIDDLNGDGFLDLAVTNADSSNVSVLPGLGDGTFAAATNWSSPGRPNHVVIGDMNGDSVRDLVVANSDQVDILFGTGGGAFAPAVTLPAISGNPIRVAIGDLNGDGANDIATANYNSHTTSVLLGTGGGTFAPPVNYGAGGLSPTGVVIDDLNSDGLLDVAFSNENSNQIAVLRGLGDGTFAPVAFFFAFAPSGLAIGDLNGDGANDIAAPFSFSNTVAILLSECLPAADLVLEIDGCPDDAIPAAGYQIAVELWMRNLPTAASGFQAFLEYDDAVLSYRGDLSTYAPSPFPTHIQSIGGAEVAAGTLRLDGFQAPAGSGTLADALLATLIFDVDVECSTVVPVTFDLTQAFDSELSYDGYPIDTDLTDAPSTTFDDTAPVLDACPDDIEQPADADAGDGCQGAFVTFSDPGATDACDPAPVVVCDPASGSFFALGTTTVTCTATDACGNESQCTFDVTITDTNAVQVEVELSGVSVAVTRCIRIVVDDCGAFTDVALSFVDHDGDDLNENGVDDATEGGMNAAATPVRAFDLIEVPCGNWSSLCAKDEQHTLWGSTTLSLADTAYAGDTLIRLGAGDTDNDGDVDVNDVTLLLAQFGDLALAGDCPWDGTRDSDFSNNGAVGSEDFSLMSENWLMLTECACTQLAPSHFRGRQVETSVPTNRLDRRIARRADLNRDGVIDFRDVALFEKAHGLPDTLSTHMLLTEQMRRH